VWPEPDTGAEAEADDTFGDGPSVPVPPDFDAIEQRELRRRVLLESAETQEAHGDINIAYARSAQRLVDSMRDSTEFVRGIGRMQSFIAANKAMASLLATPALDVLAPPDVWPVSAPPISSIAGRRDAANSLDVADGIVNWDLDELLQDHQEEAPTLLRILALPTAPSGEHLVEGTLFHRELDRHRRFSLRIDIG
jgi:hypothetical protein